MVNYYNAIGLISSNQSIICNYNFCFSVSLIISALTVNEFILISQNLELPRFESNLTQGNAIKTPEEFFQFDSGGCDFDPAAAPKTR